MIAQDTGSIDGSVRSSFKSRRPSYLRSAVEEPLLPQRRSSLESYGHDRKADSRLNQKVHIESEDLTIVIAGFSSTLTGLIIYFTLCVMTLGFAYLLFRWFPRWRVRLIGKPTPLRICQWVAIEVRRIHGINPLMSCVLLTQCRTSGTSSMYTKLEVSNMDVPSPPSLQIPRATFTMRIMTPLSVSFVI